MEKAYSRINWKNGSRSTDTPLNETNMNLMDSAIDVIDGRVCQHDAQIQTLQGYETRAAQSAAEALQSAQDSEDSATDSASSATQSSGYATNSSASATQSQNYSRDSEAWAKGTRNGTAVPSTDETYHNNSKYWCEQAQQIADNFTIDNETPTFTQASTRANINSGETISTIMGKIKKFFADLKTVAFTGNASDVSFDNTGTSSSSTTVQEGLVEALTATGFTNNGTATETDMNNVVSFGTYVINPDVTTLNVPISGTWGYVEVFKHGTNALVQLWTNVNNSSMYIRTRYGSPLVWSSWRSYEQIVTFDDLSKYGIATSGEQINSTLQEICKKVPLYCEIKIYWTGNDATRFGTLANQIPESFGSLYIHKNGYSNPCYIEFIPYDSGNHYIRNFDYVNADHLSEWVNLNTVGYAIASNEPTATSSRAYSVGQYMVRGGNLKKVTSAIASGESITSNNTSNTTVGAELTQINSNLSDIKTGNVTWNTTNKTSGTATLIKIGRICQLTLDNVSYSSITHATTIFTVPDEFKPISRVWMPITQVSATLSPTSDWTTFPVALETSGYAVIYSTSGSASARLAGARATITYISAS